MNDNTFKMVVTHNHKTVFIDFDKGNKHLKQALQKLGLQFHKIRCYHIHLKFTVYHHNYNILPYLAKKDDLFMNIYRAYQYMKYENGFKEYLQLQIDNHKVHSIQDLLLQANLFEIKKQKHRVYYKETPLEDILFEQISIFNKPAIYTNSRITSKLPIGIYRYECQHDDNHQGYICMIAPSIRINFWGTILSNKKITLGHQGYRTVNENEDIIFHNMKAISLSDYTTKYPMTRKNIYHR